MARKAIRLERTGALTPRDRLWAAIRALAGTFSAVEIHLYANRMLRKDQRAGDMTVDAALKYLESLAAGGYVETIAAQPAGREQRELRLYRLVRDVGIDAPRVGKDGNPATLGRGQELIWQAAKVLKDFDVTELLSAIAQTAQESMTAISEETARTYCYRLAQGGYLAIDASGRTKRYRFVPTKNTGPRAPVVSKDGEVIDGNTGAVVYAPSKGGRECQART